MAALWFLLTIVCLIFLIIGLVKPRAVIYWGTRTRKRVLLYYGLSILVLFVATVAAIPELPSENQAPLTINKKADSRLNAEENAKKEDMETAKLEAESKSKEITEAAAEKKTNEKPLNNAETQTAVKTQKPEITPVSEQSKKDAAVNTAGQTTEITAEKVPLWSKAINMAKSAASYIKSDDPFKSEKKQFAEEELRKWLQQEPVYLVLEERLFRPDYFKRTLNVIDQFLSGPFYIYFGEMKENKPHGKGLLLTISDSDLSYGKVFTLLYVGNFKGGIYNGYGIEYQKASTYYNDDYKSKFTRGSVPLSLDQLGVSYPEYEGYFSNGKFEGKGKYMTVTEKPENYEPTYLNVYSKANEKLIQDFENELGDDSSSLIHISTLPPLDTYVIYEGEFKKDNINGKGKLFHPTGDIKYEGQFKNGTFHGKGTLYNEDGSVKYKGKWDSGDVKG
ncbi:hypothetical protein [Paenibacillus koleovorans]|uniref:hypothetical protein n=1 Tax=Paenibacillus koleovorans TaxID=121608 RepID=UPI000FDB0994|nr:hypothetical protein [Paenibacillus koleovorans]